MSKSKGNRSTGQERTPKRSNPVALALKNGAFGQRIVKSKVVYNRKKLPKL